VRRYAYHAVQGYTYEEGQQTLQPTAKNVPLLPKTTSILYSTTVATSDADDVARIADEGAGSTDDEESEALTANGEVTSQFGIHANVSNELDLVIAEKRGKKEESRKRRALLRPRRRRRVGHHLLPGDRAIIRKKRSALVTTRVSLPNKPKQYVSELRDHSHHSRLHGLR